jgi:release factor glutamine methyltransferase
MEKIEPKRQMVENTDKLLAESEDFEVSEIEVLGHKVIRFPNVFNPKYFFSTQWFAENVSEAVKNEDDFLEMGCGTGAVSVITALKNPNIRVCSTDINPEAVRNTEFNMLNHKLGSRMQVFQGDVFDGLKNKNLKFDTIFWAMPFGYLSPEEKIDNRRAAVHDPGYRAIEKFIREAPMFLKENGRLLIGFSKTLGHFELLEKYLQENNFELNELTSNVDKENEEEVDMRIFEAKLKK